MNQAYEKLNAKLLESLKNRFKLFFEKYILEKEFFRSRIILWLLALNVLANVVDWAAIAIFINRLDGDIILHYNVYFGVDSMGDWKRVFILPIIGVIILVLNAWLAAYFFVKKERIASYILMLASLMVQISLIIAAASVMMINY
ncbi:MAG: hypothetical protein WC022_02040 [Parcubacteria group bacterium]